MPFLVLNMLHWAIFIPTFFPYNGKIESYHPSCIRWETATRQPVIEERECKVSTQQFKLRKFVAPEFVFGIDARLLTGQYARNFGAQKALIVTDAGVSSAGWTEDIAGNLEQVGVAYTIFDQVTPNPRAEEVMAGADHYHREQCDIIVAVGGGSPMDCAKGIGIVCSNKQHVLTLETLIEI